MNSKASPKYPGIKFLATKKSMFAREWSDFILQVALRCIWELAAKEGER